MSFKVGDVVEIINRGGSYNHYWYNISKIGNKSNYLKNNNITINKIANSHHDIPEIKILPVKATICEIFKDNRNTKNIYLLKIHNSKWYIFMEEKWEKFNKTYLIKSEQHEQNNDKFQTKENKIQNIKHILNNRTTIVILENGNKGIAKCLPDEQFNEFEGFCIAYYRALTGNKKAMPKLRIEDYSNKELLDEIKRRMSDRQLK